MLSDFVRLGLIQAHLWMVFRSAPPDSGEPVWAFAVATIDVPTDCERCPCDPLFKNTSDTLIACPWHRKNAVANARDEYLQSQ
jgi:hypothetical protein